MLPVLASINALAALSATKKKALTPEDERQTCVMQPFSYIRLPKFHAMPILPVCEDGAAFINPPVPQSSLPYWV